METSRSSQSNRKDVYENQNFIMIGIKIEMREGWLSEKPKKASREDSIWVWYDIIMRICEEG